jgi:hypothetical protein
VALSRRVENAHLLSHHARVDRDLARERPVVRTLASNPTVGEGSRVAAEHRGTAGECEEREMSKEVAHLVLEAGAVRVSWPHGVVWGMTRPARGA